MQGYDATLKLLLQSSSSSVLRQIFGNVRVTQWLNAELPQVQTRRADLVGLTADEKLVHLELQSSNDRDMALRMAEYALGMYRQFRRFPAQIVLYVGEPPMRMDPVLAGPEAESPNFSFRYGLLDFRDLDGQALLESERVEDNVLAVLARLKNQTAAVRQILSRIAELAEAERRPLFAQFLVLSGLRSLEKIIEEEARKMPILDDLASHKIFGPAILQGRKEGQKELISILIAKRFGSLPNWVEDRMAQLSTSELEDVAGRLLDAASLESLFPPG